MGGVGQVGQNDGSPSASDASGVAAGHVDGEHTHTPTPELLLCVCCDRSVGDHEPVHFGCDEARHYVCRGCLKAKVETKKDEMLKKMATPDENAPDVDYEKNPAWKRPVRVSRSVELECGLRTDTN